MSNEARRKHRWSKAYDEGSIFLICWDCGKEASPRTTDRLMVSDAVWDALPFFHELERQERKEKMSGGSAG